uniref:Calcium-independent phospholipase A2-gamma-like n=1 Tax=Gouania willdenowi TaxID=441366 RepID=A0A8C5E2T2_GOUWI
MMGHRCATNTWMNLRRAVFIWSASFCRLQRVGGVWRRVHHRRCVCETGQRYGFHSGSGPLNDSERWVSGLSQHMSRVRSSLESLSKAVNATHTELRSKVARLRPDTLKPAGTTEENECLAYSKQVEPDSKGSAPPQQNHTPTQQSPALFHPSTFSVNLDSYTYLANHINTYFSKTEREASVNPIPSSQSQHAEAPPPSRRSLGQYLSYIVPLVPKFRTAETRGGPGTDRQKEDGGVKEDGSVSREQTSAEEKVRKSLLQREKIIARVSVDNRTRALVQSLHRATDVRVYVSRVEDLSFHLLEFPETCVVAVKEKAVPCLLRLKQATDPKLRAAVRESLTLLGHHQAVRGRGIRILSLDGGGLRGLLALQTLQKLEDLTGKRIHQLFDYICGVSTGAVLGFLLGVFQIPLSECEDLYRSLGSDIFKQNFLVGAVKMGWNHAFYDSDAWERLLKEKMGSHLLIETSKNPECPKVAAVSTIVNRGPSLKAYVFRNYNLQPGTRSLYLGGCQHQLWEAIRATSAAPGYFQEFLLGNDLHQDGGLLINNPTAVAVHESVCVWPGVPLECVVSVGTGRFQSLGKSSNSATYSSLKSKLSNVISSATDTEEVHSMLDAFLPADTYFRFNPFLSEDVSLDERREDRLRLLQAEGERYLLRNQDKLRKAARILSREKSSLQRAAEWARLRADMLH